MITDYLGFGIENAVSRKRLEHLSGFDDRKNRDLILHARFKGHIIINIGDGLGYFKLESYKTRKRDHTPEETAAMLRQYRATQSRGKAILGSNKPLERELKHLGLL